MKFNIYNYNNEPTEIDIGNKEIEYITVEVISGDEWIHIHYEDGTKSHYRSDTALIPLYDGGYIVRKEEIQKWIELEKVTYDTISYHRLEKFTEEEE